MNSQRYFEMAQLSEASYADLLSGSNEVITNRNLIIDRLVNEQANGDRNFSTVQAEQFTDPFNGYTVLEQSPTIANGLSATLFLDNETGEKIPSIRGSNDGFDFVTDAIDIAFLGTAELQSQYQSLRDFYSILILDNHLGENETFSVTGHSLGGFLAQAFAIEFQATVSDTYTYNAPGFSEDASEVLQALQIYGNVEVPGMTNLFADQGPELTAGLGQMLGSIEGIFIEDQSGLIGALENHSRLAALVPKPRVNLTRFHGVFAPNSRCRGRVTKALRGRGGRCPATGDAEEPTPVERRASMTWAQRLKRVFTNSRRFRRHRHRDLSGLRWRGPDHRLHRRPGGHREDPHASE